ncbi:uncharacterized protein [Panulirus ornatus]|uniref:uncharacterized protein isoform X3 n=1 Tax=Panulirus ornatus TaxID=150431 RepID=UPI003A87C011
MRHILSSLLMLALLTKGHQYEVNGLMKVKGDDPTSLRPRVDVEVKGEDPTSLRPRVDVEVKGDDPTSQRPRVDVEVEEEDPTSLRPRVGVEVEGKDPAILRPRVDVEVEGEDPTTLRTRMDVEVEGEDPTTLRPRVDVEVEGEDPATLRPRVDVEVEGEDPRTLRPRVDVKVEGEDPTALSSRMDMEVEREDPTTLRPRVDMEVEGEDPTTLRPRVDVEVEGDDSTTLSSRVDVKVKGEDPTTLRPRMDVEVEGDDPTTLRPRVDVEVEGEDPTTLSSRVDVEVEGEDPTTLRPRVDMEVEGEDPTTLSSRVDVEVEGEDPTTLRPKVDVEVEGDDSTTLRPRVDVEVEGEDPTTLRPRVDMKVKGEDPTTLRHRVAVEVEGEDPATLRPRVDVEVEGEDPTTLSPRVDVEVEVEDPTSLRPKVDVEVEGEDPTTLSSRVDMEVEGEDLTTLRPRVDVKGEGEDPTSLRPRVYVDVEGEDPATLRPRVDLEVEKEDPTTLRPRLAVEVEGEDPATLRPRVEMEAEGEDPTTLSSRVDVKVEGEDPTTLRPRVDMEIEGEDPATLRPRVDVEAEGEDSTTLSYRVDVKVDGEGPTTLRPRVDMEVEGEDPATVSPRVDVEVEGEDPTSLSSRVDVKVEGEDPTTLTSRVDVEVEGEDPSPLRSLVTEVKPHLFREPFLSTPNGSPVHHTPDTPYTPRPHLTDQHQHSYSSLSLTFPTAPQSTELLQHSTISKQGQEERRKVDSERDEQEVWVNTGKNKTTEERPSPEDVKGEGKGSLEMKRGTKQRKGERERVKGMKKKVWRILGREHSEKTDIHEEKNMERHVKEGKKVRLKGDDNSKEKTVGENRTKETRNGIEKFLIDNKENEKDDNEHRNVETLEKNDKNKAKKYKKEKKTFQIKVRNKNTEDIKEEKGNGRREDSPSCVECLGWSWVSARGSKAQEATLNNEGGREYGGGEEDSREDEPQGRFSGERKEGVGVREKLRKNNRCEEKGNAILDNGKEKKSFKEKRKRENGKVEGDMKEEENSITESNEEELEGKIGEKFKEKQEIVHGEIKKKRKVKHKKNKTESENRNQGKKTHEILKEENEAGKQGGKKTDVKENIRRDDKGKEMETNREKGKIFKKEGINKQENKEKKTKETKEEGTGEDNENKESEEKAVEKEGKKEKKETEMSEEENTVKGKIESARMRKNKKEKEKISIGTGKLEKEHEKQRKESEKEKRGIKSAKMEHRVIEKVKQENDKANISESKLMLENYSWKEKNEKENKRTQEKKKREKKKEGNTRENQGKGEEKLAKRKVQKEKHNARKENGRVRRGEAKDETQKDKEKEKNRKDKQEKRKKIEELEAKKDHSKDGNMRQKESGKEEDSENRNDDVNGRENKFRDHLRNRKTKKRGKKKEGRKKEGQKKEGRKEKGQKKEGESKDEQKKEKELQKEKESDNVERRMKVRHRKEKIKGHKKKKIKQNENEECNEDILFLTERREGSRGNRNKNLGKERRKNQHENRKKKKENEQQIDHKNGRKGRWKHNKVKRDEVRESDACANLLLVPSTVSPMDGPPRGGTGDWLQPPSEERYGSSDDAGRGSRWPKNHLEAIWQLDFLGSRWYTRSSWQVRHLQPDLRHSEQWAVYYRPELHSYSSHSPILSPFTYLAPLSPSHYPYLPRSTYHSPFSLSHSPYLSSSSLSPYTYFYPPHSSSLSLSSPASSHSSSPFSSLSTDPQFPVVPPPTYAPFMLTNTPSAPRTPSLPLLSPSLHTLKLPVLGTKAVVPHPLASPSPDVVSTSQPTYSHPPNSLFADITSSSHPTIPRPPTSPPHPGIIYPNPPTSLRHPTSPRLPISPHPGIISPTHPTFPRQPTSSRLSNFRSADAGIALRRLSVPAGTTVVYFMKDCHGAPSTGVLPADQPVLCSTYLLEPQPQPLLQPRPQLILQPQPKPLLQPRSQPILQPQPLLQSQPQPLLQSQAQLLLQTQPQPLWQLQPQLLLQPQPQLLFQQYPQPLLQPQPQQPLQPQLQMQPQQPLSLRQQQLLPVLPPHPLSLWQPQPQPKWQQYLQLQPQPQPKSQSQLWSHQKPAVLLQSQPMWRAQKHPQQASLQEPTSSHSHLDLQSVVRHPDQTLKRPPVVSTIKPPRLSTPHSLPELLLQSISLPQLLSTSFPQPQPTSPPQLQPTSVPKLTSHSQLIQTFLPHPTFIPQLVLQNQQPTPPSQPASFPQTQSPPQPVSLPQSKSRTQQELKTTSTPQQRWALPTDSGNIRGTSTPPQQRWPLPTDSGNIRGTSTPPQQRWPLPTDSGNIRGTSTPPQQRWPLPTDSGNIRGTSTPPKQRWPLPTDSGNIRGTSTPPQQRWPLPTDSGNIRGTSTPPQQRWPLPTDSGNIRGTSTPPQQRWPLPTDSGNIRGTLTPPQQNRLHLDTQGFKLNFPQQQHQQQQQIPRQKHPQQQQIPRQQHLQQQIPRQQHPQQQQQTRQQHPLQQQQPRHQHPLQQQQQPRHHPLQQQQLRQQHPQQQQQPQQQHQEQQQPRQYYPKQQRQLRLHRRQQLHQLQQSLPQQQQQLRQHPQQQYQQQKQQPRQQNWQQKQHQHHQQRTRQEQQKQLQQQQQQQLLHMHSAQLQQQHQQQLHQEQPQQQHQQQPKQEHQQQPKQEHQQQPQQQHQQQPQQQYRQNQRQPWQPHRQRQEIRQQQHIQERLEPRQDNLQQQEPLQQHPEEQDLRQQNIRQRQEQRQLFSQQQQGSRQLYTQQQQEPRQLHPRHRQEPRQLHYSKRKDIKGLKTGTAVLQPVQPIPAADNGRDGDVTAGDGIVDMEDGEGAPDVVGAVGMAAVDRRAADEVGYEGVADDEATEEEAGGTRIYGDGVSVKEADGDKVTGGHMRLLKASWRQLEHEPSNDTSNSNVIQVVPPSPPPPPRTGLRRSSRDLGLSHYTLPDPAPQLRYTPIEQTVSPGSPVSLKCSAVGSPIPVITWTRDHQPLLTSHRTSVGSFRTALGEVVSHVNLSDVTVREGGTYTCTAHSAAGSVTHSARLNVYGPPFVRAMPNVTAVAGEEVRLWCPAGGFPTPSITWRRDGHALPNSHRQEVIANGTLVLRVAAFEDAGRYSCLVSGSQGQTAASHTFLHVLKPPEIETFTFRRNLEEGRRTQLSCTVTGGDLPITINWLKDGRHLQHDPDVESKQVSEFSMALIFKRLREHHSGSYTCEAANAAAAVNHTAALRVKVSPKWVVEPSSGKALVGSTVLLNCGARGYPTPIVTWKMATGKAAQDFQPMVVDGIRSTQAANGSLVLQDTKTSDAGWYRCTAANSVGKPISKDVQLTVHAPARVVTEGRRVTGHAGQTVMVACEATGDPVLTLTWRRHHAPVTPSHRTSIRESKVGSMVRAVLKIRAVTPADAGAYTCLATNPHGDHSQVFDIAIIEPPTAPGAVTVSEITSRSAVISWTLPQPASVTIQYKAAAEESWASHGRNVSVGQWTSSHVVTGLVPHRTYAVRLMAHNDLGVSQPSHTHVFTTTEEAPSGAPRDVRVTAGGAHSLLVTWRAPDPGLTHGALRGYTLALRRQNLQGHLTFITRPVTDVDGVEQYEARGLAPATLYEVAVRAFTRAGPGPLSSPRIVDSTSHDAPSCPPAGVLCRGSGRGGVRVWWSPPPTHCARAPVTGYSVMATPTAHAHLASDSRIWEVKTTNLEKNLDGLPPATNISVRVKAYNDVGFSTPSHPVFCLTENDVPGPPERVRVVVTGDTTVLVTWAPPEPYTGTVLHYTLYSTKDDQVAVRDVVGAGGSEATWRELTGLTPASRIQVWVTATTVAGEGNPSPRLTALPSPKPTHSPVAMGGGRTWRVGAGAGVTLGCRGLGTPSPTIGWTRAGAAVSSGHLTQLLPGGDLHLTAVTETANYTCWVRNSVGVDTLTHQVVAVGPPTPPTLALAHATHHALNLTVTPTGDGGAPILGYAVHHRGRAGEWVEMSVDPGSDGVVVRGLPCGAPHHLYLTAWNALGTSSPSPVLIANTLGSPPGRPDPARLVEANSTCVTLRLYVWPELGCPVTHWKVELGNEEGRVGWTPLHSHVTRDATDLGVCDLTSASWHLLRVTASSTAGDTAVVYRVATTDTTGGSIIGESVQEVAVGRGAGPTGWLDAHIIAGVVSALLLAAAFIICVCVAVRKRRYGGYRQGRSGATNVIRSYVVSRQGESVDQKGGGEEDNARNSEITRAHLYSPTPTKKSRGSLASLKTQDDASDPYEICPYATFSSEGTLEYGLSLHAMTPRDCLDHPAGQSDSHQQSPAYGQVGRQRTQSHYKETEIAYISRVGRGDYAGRPKSLPGAQPPTASTNAPTPSAATSEQRPWPEEARRDTRGRSHRPRSRTRAETLGGGRDSSTESNDASSPVQQRHHFQPQAQHQAQHPTHHHHTQQLAPQHPQQQVAVAAAARVGSHPLPPVRQARPRTESTSSDSSSLTPPRPLHPPSAFSDSKELSEAECDREVFQAQNVGGVGVEGPRPGVAVTPSAAPRGSEESIKAELTVLLQRYQDKDEDGKQQQHKKRRFTDKNPYTINV